MTLRDLPADRLDSLLAHREWVRAVARALVADPNDADDVEQQTWLAALARPPRDDGSLRGWLGATTRNVARKLGRARTRRAHYEGAVPPGADAAPASDLVAEAEIQQRIGRAVLALDEPFRSTVLLRYFEGLAPADVAARLGVPVETVRSRLRRAHERLRGQLDEESGGSRAAWAMAVLAWEAARPPAAPVGAAAPAASAAPAANAPPAAIAAPAAISPPAAIATAATGALAGGLAMPITKKVLVAAVLLAAIGATTWVATVGQSGATPWDEANEATGTSASGPPAGAPRPRRATLEPADEVATATADAPLPPPFDLDAADRDLDLHGTVVDAAGAGVPGARVATVTYPWRVAGVHYHKDHDVEVAGSATRSARDGTFSLRLARGESVALRVAADGFAAVEIPSVLAGERVRVTLRQGVRLVVALADAAGAPLAGGEVRVFSSGGRNGSIESVRAHGTTGADGVCTFDSLPPSANVFVDHPGGNGRWVHVTLPATGELRREIRFSAARTIRGAVIDAKSRRPVEGARVGMGWTLHSPTTTGADGTYTLTGWTGEGVGEIQVRADGYASEGREVRDATTLDFELDRGYAAAGRVVDEGGAPVAGALVSVVAADWANGVQWVSDGYATTGPDGRFRTAGLRWGMRHAIVVLATGHARVRRAMPIVAAGAPDEQDLGDVVLPRPRRVEGVVLQGDGSPSRRVSVALHPGIGNGAGDDEAWIFYGGYVSAVTDDLGRFRFSGVAPDSYVIKVRPEGAHEIRADVSVPPGRDVLDLRIARASTRKVRFRVTDADGAPVPGMYVHINGSSVEGIQAMVDAEGAAELEVPTAVRLLYSASDPPGPHGKFLTTPWREIPDAVKDVAIVLEEGALITGRVVDPDGAPVAGASMKLVGAAGQESYAQAREDGWFDALVPRAGRTTLLFEGTAYRDGRAVDTGMTARVEGIAAGADVVVECTRGATDRKLSVVVVSPQGEPVEGAWVNATWGGGSQSRRVKTDAEGRASFDALPAREITVGVSVQSKEFLRPDGVAVVPGGQELRLVCRAASRITGFLADEKGRAVAGIDVEALRDGRQVGRALTDAEGKFVLLLPVTDTTLVRLYVDRNRDDTPDVIVDGVAPGTQDVPLIIGGSR